MILKIVDVMRNSVVRINTDQILFYEDQNHRANIWVKDIKAPFVVEKTSCEIDEILAGHLHIFEGVHD